MEQLTVLTSLQTMNINCTDDIRSGKEMNSIPGSGLMRRDFMAD